MLNLAKLYTLHSGSRSWPDATVNSENCVTYRSARAHGGKATSDKFDEPCALHHAVSMVNKEALQPILILL